MEVKRSRTLATEIFKIKNNINPKFMRDIFITKSKAFLQKKERRWLQIFATKLQGNYSDNTKISNVSEFN